MKEIVIRHEYKKELDKDIEIKKLKWLIDCLSDKYSYQAVEVAINKIYK